MKVDLAMEIETKIGNAMAEIKKENETKIQLAVQEAFDFVVGQYTAVAEECENQTADVNEAYKKAGQQVETLTTNIIAVDG